jgi:predicted Zn finger-like uncharacterized protein
MKSTCSTCGTTYRIDPVKVPRSGIRARCSNCEGVFRVTRESADIPGSAGVAQSDEAGAVAVGATSSSAPEAEFGERSPAAENVVEPVSSVAETAEPQEEEQTGSAGESAPIDSPFGIADPQIRARRLARALVSDIVVYHPEKREASLRSRTLRVDFQDEIRKSWNEYVAQVGEPMARGTPYFREALNEILAGGERVF